MTIAFSIYILLAGYLYYRDKNFYKRATQYLEQSMPVPAGAVAGIVFAFALLLPVIEAERLIRRVLGIEKKPTENADEIKQIAEEICPERVHDLSDASIELNRQDVEPFLRLIPELFDSGLTETWIQRIMDDVRGLEVGEDNRHTFYAMRAGGRIPLITELQRIRKDCFVVLFWAPESVAAAIDAKMAEFCTETEAGNRPKPSKK